MPVTTIDPNTALIVVDLQKGVASAPLLTPLGQVVEQTNKLLDVFHQRGLPVVLVVVEGMAPGRTEQARKAPREFPADFSEPLPEVHHESGDHIVRKRTPGAFPHTGLEDLLIGLGVTQVVITGVATATGVESTARQAYELGFNVTLALDAMSDTGQEAEDYSVNKIFPRLGETGSTAEIIALIEKMDLTEGSA